MAAAKLASGSTVALAQFVSILDQQLTKRGKAPLRLNLAALKFSPPKIEAIKGSASAAAKFDWSAALAAEEGAATKPRAKKEDSGSNVLLIVSILGGVALFLAVILVVLHKQYTPGAPTQWGQQQQKGQQQNGWGQQQRKMPTPQNKMPQGKNPQGKMGMMPSPMHKMGYQNKVCWGSVLSGGG